MKKTLTALATICAFVAPAAFAESKTYKVDDFSKIEVDGAMHVIFKTGAQTSVVVETASGDFSDAKIESEGDALHVSRESLDSSSGWFNFGNRSVNISDNGKIVKVNGKKVPYYTVYVTGPDLEAVKVAQSSRFESQTIDADDFEARASSSAEVTLAGVAANAQLSASSSGELDASGLKATILSASASSSGELDATVTGTGETNIDASSSGEVDVKSLKAAQFVVDSSSGASAKLSGACSTIKVSASSGAEVEAGELRCATATASASSGAEVEIFASQSASARASSGGDISFAGNPAQQDVSKSSGGSVSFH